MSPFTGTIPRFTLEVGMKRMIDRFEQLWCRSMHAQAMWPFRGRYRCQVCLREYPVTFESVAQHSPAVGMRSVDRWQMNS
jgi:hypothetical protein